MGALPPTRAGSNQATQQVPAANPLRPGAGAALVAGTHVPGPAPSGGHDEPGLRVGLPHALGEVEAIFAGEVEVHEIKMNQIAADQGILVFGKFQLVGLMALSAEQLGGGDTEAFVVFDQGDALRVRHRVKRM